MLVSYASALGVGLDSLLGRFRYCSACTGLLKANFCIFTRDRAYVNGDGRRIPTIVKTFPLRGARRANVSVDGVEIGRIRRRCPIPLSAGCDDGEGRPYLHGHASRSFVGFMAGSASAPYALNAPTTSSRYTGDKAPSGSSRKRFSKATSSFWSIRR